MCFKYLSECELSYGEKCQNPCSAHCINQTCDRINGSCLYGCKEGEQCDESIQYLTDFGVFLKYFHFLISTEIDKIQSFNYIGCT